MVVFVALLLVAFVAGCKQASCVTCSGDGMWGDEKCTVCGGDGKLDVPPWPDGTELSDCPDCGGGGSDWPDDAERPVGPCKKCSGRGTVPR